MLLKHFSIIILLSLSTGPAHAMFISMLVKFLNKHPPPTCSEVEKPSYDKLLRNGNLEVFLENAEMDHINPNHFISSQGQTALMLACAQDKTGEIVKKLLACGDLDKVNNGMRLLNIAIDNENWPAVDAILACEELKLSKEDIDLACSSIFKANLPNNAPGSAFL